MKNYVAKSESRLHIIMLEPGDNLLGRVNEVINTEGINTLVKE